MFIDDRKVTKTISHLQFIARLTMYALHSTNEVEDMDEEKAKTLSKQQPSIFRHLSSIKAYYNQAIFHDITATTKISWKVVDGRINYEAINVDSSVFLLENMRHVYTTTIRDPIVIMHNILGFENQFFNRELVLYDDLGNSTPHYSLQNEPHTMMLFEEVNARLKTTLQKYSQDTHKIQHFKNMTEKVCRCLMVLVFQAGGPPPRMTEFLDTTLLVNTLERQRSIFWVDGRMLFLQSKSKSYYQTGYRPVARFMPRILSRILFWFFHLMKPAYHLMCEHITKDNSTGNSNSLYAWNLMGPPKYQLFRSQLIAYLVKICDTLDVRKYRHVMQLVCEQKLMYLSTHLDNMNMLRAAIDNQFGHTTKVLYLTLDI